MVNADVPEGGPTVPFPLASVVIGSTKVDAWLEECIDSVLANSYPNLEVILVLNGAPADDAPRQSADGRVRVLRFPDRVGPAGAANRGIAAASGVFCIRIDADDVMSPDRIRRQVDILRTQNDVALVGTLVDWIDESGAVVGRFPYASGVDVRQELVRQNVVPHSSIAVRIADIVEVGEYDEGLEQMEDYDLILRLSACGRIAVLDEVLTKYRLHPSQMSRSVRPTGRYVRVILADRQALARRLGIHWFRTFRNDCWWLAQQWGMYVYRVLRRAA